jgi:hypothetical protein
MGNNTVCSNGLSFYLFLAFNSLNYTRLMNTTVGKYWSGKDMEGSGPVQSGATPNISLEELSNMTKAQSG